MKLLSFVAIAACVSASTLALPSRADEPVRVQGVANLMRVVKAAVPQLHDLGIEIKFGEECGNGQAIAALGNSEIDVALLGRSLTAEDRASYPDKSFEEQQVGEQVVVLLVSRAIWESGVRALKRAQVAELYEGRVESWKQLGGANRSPKFFESAHGRGVWEIFASWLFGDLRKAPAVAWDVVADGAEAQNAVQFNSGGIAAASLRWADRREVFPLAIIDESGAAIEPTSANVAAGKYPLARPAFFAVGDKPAGNKRKLLEFFRSEQGQAIVAGNDLLPVTTLKQP
jgi:phosphate transport system substrate-binding protein